MKKQFSVAILTLTALTINIIGAKADNNPLSGSKLSDSVCKSNFTTCANIAESANTIGIIYRNKNKTDEEAGNIAKDSLSKPGTGWDKGYNPENVSIISREWKPDFSPVPLVDSQAIFATKVVNEGGVSKKQFMISVRGTEQLQDWITNFAALKPRDYENGTKVGNGFLNYAFKLAESSEFDNIVTEIIKSAKNNERYEVLVSGHSLGGAAAVILKAEIENRLVAEGMPSAREKVSAITFGAPPVGDAEFAKRYGDRVIGINISGDPVPSMGLPFLTEKVGSIYEFERPNDFVNVFDKLAKRGDQIGNKILNRDVAGVFRDVILSPLEGGVDVLTTVAGVDSHVTGYSEDRYGAARNNGWYDLRNELTNHNLNNINNIIQGGSSHIGSASYYLGRSPNQDPRIENIYVTDRFDSSTIKSVQEREQFITPAGSITNLKAPVDVVLNWDQSLAKGQLDLDSHLTGPAGLGDDSSVRFHTYFSSKGSTNTAPYVLLYRDVIPSTLVSGNEQTRIQVLQNGVYRFYVHDYTNSSNSNSTALSQSGANVAVYNFGKDLPTEGQNLGTPLGGMIKVPTNQQGNVWRSFELDSRTGVLKPVNAPLGNVNAPSSVPSIGESFSNTGGTGGK